MTQHPNGVVAVVLAAGKGTRMKSATPKVLHAIGGVPMISRILAAADEVAQRSVVVVSPGADALRAAVVDGHRDGSLGFAEQTQQRGTGDALRAALPELGDASRILVLSGDVPLLTPATLARFLAAVPTDAVGIVTVTVADPTGLGRIRRDAAGAVAGIVEEKDANEAERRINEINAGIYVLPGAYLCSWLERLDAGNAQGEYYLTDVVAFAVADGVAVVAMDAGDPDEVAGVNDRVQLARLERVLQRRRAEALMRSGVTLHDPARIDLRGELSAGEDCEIDVGCVFSSRVVLGRGVRIGAHCVIEDAEIGDDSVIEPFTHIRGARIAERATIGPFARLREGTVLAGQVKIGNFVETKKTRMGRGSKANHLAYLGDATLGAECNVGAGTITCNYDGVAKHPTVLGDGVFVGSNSTLVAPVELGTGAYVAAGSTVTTGVPADSLAVGRARQRNIEGWRSPRRRGANPRDET